MKTLITMSIAALITATSVAAAEVKVSVGEGDAFVGINDVQNDNFDLLYLSMPEMQDFIQTRDPELVITGVDSNGNGVLDQDEFVITGDISVWDADGDGVLTGAELQAALMTSGVVGADGGGLLTQDVAGTGNWTVQSAR